MLQVPIRLATERFAMQNRWLSVGEIAEYLGVSKDTVYGWVGSKGMPGHKVGRFWKFKLEEIDDWVRAGGAAMSAPGKGDESE
jgi:excisionase family DNA binding protein